MSKQTPQQIMKRANILYEGAPLVNSLATAQKALAEASELIYRLAENQAAAEPSVRVGSAPSNIAEGQEGEAE